MQKLLEPVSAQGPPELHMLEGSCNSWAQSSILAYARNALLIVGYHHFHHLLHLPYVESSMGKLKASLYHTYSSAFDQISEKRDSIPTNTVIKSIYVH